MQIKVDIGSQFSSNFMSNTLTQTTTIDASFKKRFIYNILLNCLQEIIFNDLIQRQAIFKLKRIRMVIQQIRNQERSLQTRMKCKREVDSRMKYFNSNEVLIIKVVNNQIKNKMMNIEIVSNQIQIHQGIIDSNKLDIKQ
ncbi:unnamed protein product [Paramecium octaurelia]|uniref:Uncharacterized protein n=1 Tax=Paramecium octaurelia TaxID=43137 RepID=A0A8S1XXX5_PAROT|nr:unnamed protein product [Paramecium octaurelia]